MESVMSIDKVATIMDDNNIIFSIKIKSYLIWHMIAISL